MTIPGTSPEITVKDKIVIYFLSSSNPQDIEACKTVHNHLSQFIRNSKPSIEIYSDYSIDAGVETEKYKEILYTADLVIAFGSSDFIADDITIDRINKVILRYNNRQTRLLAIIVRNFLWREPFFGNLPVILPSIKKPLYDQKTWSIDDAFATVAQELKDVIMKHYKIEQSTIEIIPWNEE
jgi:hypothetical protein